MLTDVILKVRGKKVEKWGEQTSRVEHKLLATHHFQANIHDYHIQVFILYSRFGIQTFRSYHFPVIKTDLTTLSVRNFLTLAKCKVANDNTRSGTSNTNQHLCLITSQVIFTSPSVQMKYTLLWLIRVMPTCDFFHYSFLHFLFHFLEQ